ncbi:MAG: hypothetical protein A3H60_01880 [Candidatus Zambryskibacteria bacterium RIFCSPLOWO2_02_FULL_44_12b]|uniref:PsbP C-terminal domain-containing protein n=1 Tax=Candidatus Zambryskibacteria bacterium RIFCSPLOWO2_02_FULL_44_12b TaxID=1802772 RepID=A0A1G2UN75_9BACT|nr:MAG: hypothetical protein A3H60_01880 [Candidatus Zambryskibacteria bacterium RIFCSPLOWO2_02_FULL_44_12b]
MPPEQNPLPPEQKHWTKTILIIVVIVIIGGGIYGYTSYLSKEGDGVQEIQESVTDTSTSSPTLTTSWQNYRNEEYGFEFRYPKDWIQQTNYQDDPSLVTVVSDPEIFAAIKDCYEGCGPDIWFFYYPNKDLEKYVSNKNNLIFDHKKITFANQNAYEATEGGYSSYFTILIQKDTAMYKILFFNRGAKKDLDDIDNQILSTFKFIE